MDLVSFETQQEYEWVKTFITGEKVFILCEEKKSILINTYIAMNVNENIFI